MFGGGTMAGAKVARVIHIYPIGDGGEMPLAGEGIELGEKLVLAVIAAIGVVRDVQRIFSFVRFDPFVTNSVIAHK